MLWISRQLLRRIPAGTIYAFGKELQIASFKTFWILEAPRKLEAEANQAPNMESWTYCYFVPNLNRATTFLWSDIVFRLHRHTSVVPIRSNIKSSEVLRHLSLEHGRVEHYV